MVGQQVKEKENSELKPVKLRLKIDLVSYPARAEGLVNIYIYIYVCVCVCVCSISHSLSLSLYIYIYIYILFKNYFEK